METTSTSLDAVTLIIYLIIWLFILFLYLLPMFIALNRKHRNALAISLLNVLIGWTAIGWVISLVWACTDNTK